MSEHFINSINLELGASLTMLETAIANTTPEIWNHPDDEVPFWRRAFHTVFYCSFYFSDFDLKMQGKNTSEEYRLPPNLEDYDGAQWTEKEFVKPIEKEELLRFLEDTRISLRTYFDDGLVSSQFNDETSFDWLDMTKGTLLLYNMRHIMEHTGNLNDILRKHDGKTSKWKALIPV